MMITSASNERIKSIKKLVKSSKERDRRGVYVVENIRMFREIPEDGIEELVVSKSASEKYEKELGKWREKCVLTADSVFSGLSDTGTPQGILAVVRKKKYSLEEICGHGTKDVPFILVLESLQDPGNLGTIIRTAEGAGVTGILISGDSVDLYNPKVVRSTMGSIFRVPICISENLKEDVDCLKKRGIYVYGAHLYGGLLYEKDFRTPCAFLIGNEGKGLSDEVSKCANELLKIPMQGKVESLNAAISAAVLSYEVLRQRMC